MKLTVTLPLIKKMSPKTKFYGTDKATRPSKLTISTIVIAVTTASITTAIEAYINKQIHLIKAKDSKNFMDKTKRLLQITSLVKQASPKIGTRCCHRTQMILTKTMRLSLITMIINAQPITTNLVFPHRYRFPQTSILPIPFHSQINFLIQRLLPCKTLRKITILNRMNMNLNRVTQLIHLRTLIRFLYRNYNKMIANLIILQIEIIYRVLRLSCQKLKQLTYYSKRKPISFKMDLMRHN